MEEIEVVDVEQTIKDLPNIIIKEGNHERGAELASVSMKHEIMDMQKMWSFAEQISRSSIIPQQYQNDPANCFVALEISGRMGVSFMVVMQNLYIVRGKPSWSGSAIGAMLMASPKFKNVELVYDGTKGQDDWRCYAQAVNVNTGKLIKGGTVSIGVAKAEGWYGKDGSKWKTMPELMLAYRAYAWFARVYAPELILGMQSSEEVADVEPAPSEVNLNPYG